MATPHIAAEKGAFAKTVLMPGDPLRAKLIAETYFENPVLVNNVRGIQGYTGTYKDVPISVMASGMGIPAIGIYSYELYSFYGVENIIRIGSAGALQQEVHLRELIAATGAHTDSNFAAQYGLNGTVAPVADYTLLSTAVEAAQKLQLPMHVGTVFCSDVFYDDDPQSTEKWAKVGALATEMESAGLYWTAQRLRKRALTLVTVSDHILTKEKLSAEDRQNTFSQMMELALETAVAMAQK